LIHIKRIGTWLIITVPQTEINPYTNATSPSPEDRLYPDFQNTPKINRTYTPVKPSSQRKGPGITVSFEPPGVPTVQDPENLRSDVGSPSKLSPGTQSLNKSVSQSSHQPENQSGMLEKPLLNDAAPISNELLESQELAGDFDIEFGHEDQRRFAKKIFRKEAAAVRFHQSGDVSCAIKAYSTVNNLIEGEMTSNSANQDRRAYVQYLKERASITFYCGYISHG